MQLKTILNRVTNYKSFVFGKAEIVESISGNLIEVEVQSRKNGHRICSGCSKVRPGYDTMPTPRRFDFVPMWGMAVVFIYFMRRVNCPDCGVRVEQVPWGDGKSPVTHELKWFLAKWAKLMSWKEVATAFRVSWDCVFESVKQAVSWGLSHRNLEGIESIGIDEVQWHRGHKYQTLVYQIDEGRKRLLWIGPDRTAKTLLRFFRFLGKDRTEKLQFICSDMWQAYLKVILKKASQAIHVLDRFHVMQLMSHTRGNESQHYTTQNPKKKILKNLVGEVRLVFAFSIASINFFRNSIVQVEKLCTVVRVELARDCGPN